MPHDGSQPARIEDVGGLALGMPHVAVDYGTGDNPVYQVGGKSFVFFRNPRPDAVDSRTGERFRDVIVFWVASEGTSKRWCKTTRRRSSPPRISMDIRQPCCEPAVSVS